MDERMIDLESRLAFQEQAIHSLSETVIEQQRLIDTLSRTMEALRERIKALDPSPVDPLETEPPPPHY
ncbi:MAG: SlyX family protein [Candidatus Thiodiazotropha sp. (ex Dulcina madagascariensis)]|nr:SlyX family protein [Candidatus Thiodiazotropha sp. (ex Dulcina madagascariensis)]MCU7924823.1 SlyX family protein [Candidatus Thiodiazotropha sp. (ex Dulcina madagascariensis)]